ncbi:serine/threonine protein kinase [Pengzhenrongella frigida]|uniref:non-specific serine/threonine protein kinase n=2 Tax=Pengzhenrongella frigida TaxID=1259133 RepID=A0A4Q5N388_9MICO|nr:serine/threonine protein kinase [Cellulomonas sp. HLT2-17]
MAEVYRARDTLLGREVALKVFRDTSTESTFDARQQAEIGLLARLDHPGLVTIFDAGSGVLDGATRAFLVIELVRGPSLADRLAGGPLPPTQAALIGTQVAESLAYIHEAGVVHRDVKPANILLPGDARSGTTQPWAKLTDFGIARLVDEARLTATGMLLGTPSYLSPEQATGTVLGPPTDVYALGLVLLECLTGERVFPGTVLESVAARLHHDPVVPAALGPWWVDLLTSMTAREPASRLTALEASAALRHLIAVPDPTRVLGATAAPTSAPAPVRRTATTEAAATQVLPGLPGPTQTLTLPPEPAAVGQTLAGPALAGRRRTVALVLAAVVLGAVLAVVIAVSGGDAQPDPAPSYPAVPGQLGEHLEHLQESVTP